MVPSLFRAPFLVPATLFFRVVVVGVDSFLASSLLLDLLPVVSAPVVEGGTVKESLVTSTLFLQLLLSWTDPNKSSIRFIRSM